MANHPTGRALELLSLLQTHKRWTGPELAARLAISDRTLRRDVDRLRDLGYPVEATSGIDGGYRLAAGAHMPPLVLDDDEAIAIAVGLRAAASAAIDGIEDSSLRALAKLEQILPDRLRRRVSAIHTKVATLRWGELATGQTVNPDDLAVLAQACRDCEEVRFEYQRRDGEASRRLVQPHQLVSSGRHWYLAAFDLRRGDWRTFRLDRLRDVQLAGGRFEPRPIPDGDAASYVASSIQSMPRTLHATVLITCDEEELARSLHWANFHIDEVRSGRCRVTLRADSVDRLVSTVVSIARFASVTVESPDDVVVAVRDLRARLLAV